MKLIESCVCGNNSDFESKTVHNIPVLECKQCGIMHQDLVMTSEEYFNFYIEKYHTHFQTDRGTSTYNDRYKHDSDIAEIRYGQYRRYLLNCKRSLDIGSSNNAFVDMMNRNGFKAYGVEIGSEGVKHPKTTYTSDLLNIGFPGSYFDFISLHDVLEHFIDPVPYLQELHKILTDTGYLVVDFPNFFEPEGKHHWKHTEHLWFLTPAQLTRLFEQYGFSVYHTTKPIPSKLVYYLKKKPAHKKKLLFMPGMGDIYWCLTKAESFIKENNLGIPESYIWDLDQKKIGTQQRSENFLNRFPFMEYKGTLDKRIAWAFNEFYTHKDAIGAQGKIKKPGATAKWYVEGFEDFDYVFNMNGILETGESMVNSNGLDKYATAWQPTMFTPLEEVEYQEYYRNKYGKFIFGYFTGTGDYDKIFNQTITPEYVYAIAERLHEETGAVLVLTGTTWDAQNAERIQKCDKKGIIFSEVNQTDTSKLFALMKESIGVFGWPAGNTIVAASMFHKPTVIVWSKNVWHAGFATQCVDPAANETYMPLYVEDFASNYKDVIEVVVAKMLNAIGFEQEVQLVAFEPSQEDTIEIVPEPVVEQAIEPTAMIVETPVVAVEAQPAPTPVVPILPTQPTSRRVQNLRPTVQPTRMFVTPIGRGSLPKLRPHK